MLIPVVKTVGNWCRWHHYLDPPSFGCLLEAWSLIDGEADFSRISRLDLKPLSGGPAPELISRLQRIPDKVIWGTGAGISRRVMLSSSLAESDI